MTKQDAEGVPHRIPFGETETNPHMGMCVQAGAGACSCGDVVCTAVLFTIVGTSRNTQVVNMGVKGMEE